MKASSSEGRADAHVSATRNRDTGTQAARGPGRIWKTWDADTEMESTEYHMVRGKDKLILMTWATL